MSIRIRLALWYGALFAIILAGVAFLSYAFHARGHYDDLDRALITSAGHAAAEAISRDGAPHLVEGSGGLEVVLRLYDADGRLVESSGSLETLPAMDPRALPAAEAEPAVDPLVRLVPGHLMPPPAPLTGTFAVLTTPTQRWRTFVVPLEQIDMQRGFIEALMPLGRLDTSIRRYRLLLLGLALGGVSTALAGSWAVAGRALRPIAQMVQTARAIAHTRSLARRVTPPRRRDELGRLAETFNEMLGNLEESSQAQQRFVSDASHELRAPLTVIQGNLELIRRMPAMPPEERAEALAEAEREAARLARLVADLLALARADAGVAVQHRPVDLDDIVLDAFRAARQLARGQTLVLEPFEPARVLGDADRLKQLVVILLDNALKYTPADGRVTLGLQRAGARVELLVADTGVGIAQADLPHVFERFYRADPARGRDPGGTGLGLAIAAWIVAQHGGEIALASQPAQGTRATVLLPAASSGA